jgi:hypothetical protein
MSEDRDSFVSEEYLKNVWHVRPVLDERVVVCRGLVNERAGAQMLRN